MDIQQEATRTSSTIVPLRAQHLGDASELLAAAFFEYPVFTCYFPNPARRARYLPWYLRNVVKCAQRYGEAWTNPENTGVLLTLPPGHTSLSIREYVRNGFLPAPLVLGLRSYLRSMECQEFVDRTQRQLMRGRHYYLWLVAVDPGRQGEGIGTALMQPFLARADAEGVPVYLETHHERNVRYYERRGFSVLHETAVPKHNLPMWCLRSSPSLAGE